MESSYSDDVLDAPGFYRDLAPEIPRYVILNMVSLLDEFSSEIADSLFGHPNIEEALADVLMVVSRLKDAEKNILDRQFELFQEHYAGDHFHEIRKYTGAWAAFAHSVLKNLETIGLYRHNFLNYQLFQIRSNCVILEKMQYPELNDELYRRHGILTFNHRTSSRRWSHAPAMRVG